MAFAKITIAPKSNVERTEMVIIGGGICGLIAAQNCEQRKIGFRLIEKNDSFGGNWYTLANNYSHLQAYEPNYRWSEEHRLNTDPLTKNSGVRVLSTLKKFAADYNVPARTSLSTEVVDVVHNTNEKQGKYLVTCKNVKTGEESYVACNFLCVTSGILSTQRTAEQCGIKDVSKFKGGLTYGGKHEGVDCAAGNTDLTGKKVIIVGSGSFAAEALEACERSNAEHVTILSRPRYRLLLPFSRQYTISAIANTPLVPWSIKYRVAMWYIHRYFFKPAGLEHWFPRGKPHEIDYAGQCSDGYFRMSYQKKLTCKVAKITRMEAKSAILESGEKLPCDMLIVASGCHYNLSPSYLKHLGVDNHSLHNFAFLGKNPRIGTASDFVFAYVPFGPMKQMEMFFHAVDCIRKGIREHEVAKALVPTPLPNAEEAGAVNRSGITTGTAQQFQGNTGAFKGGRMAGHYTFFEYDHWWSANSKAQQARIDAMLNTLDIGKSPMQRLGYRVWAFYDNTKDWVKKCYWSLVEIHRFPVFGKGVGDHYGLQRDCLGVKPTTKKAN